MATVQYRICDRCKLRIYERSRLLAKVTRVTKVRWIVCGMVNETTKELCGECSKSLDEFLKPISVDK